MVSSKNRNYYRNDRCNLVEIAFAAGHSPSSPLLSELRSFCTGANVKLVVAPMSALPRKADIAQGDRHVRFWHKADIG
jgi:hypothetical protein